MLFGLDFLAPTVQPGIGSVHSFKINANGTLTQPPGRRSCCPKPGGPAKNPDAAAPPLPLGMNQHPSRNILYIGLVTRQQVGVFTFDGQSGALSFVRAVPNSGVEFCWIRPTASGARIYTVDNIDNSVSFYDNGDPLQPVEKQHLF